MDSHELLQSSRRWMQAGLEAFSREGDPHDFAVHHAAVGLEHLLKTYLVSIHPALIVDPRHLDSLLHAVGQGSHAITPATRTKTIGLVDAFERVRRLLRHQITIDDRTFASVSNARNGVAHVGVHDIEEVRHVVTTCVRIAEPILAKLDVTADSYWGDYLTLRDELASEHATTLRLAVETKLVRAKRTYTHALTVSLPSSASPSSPPSTKLDWDQRLSGSPTGILPEARAMLYTTTYDCATCGLQLDDEELTLACVPEELELDEDLGDYYSYA